MLAHEVDILQAYEAYLSKLKACDVEIKTNGFYSFADLYLNLMDGSPDYSITASVRWRNGRVQKSYAATGRYIDRRTRKLMISEVRGELIVDDLYRLSIMRNKGGQAQGAVISLSRTEPKRLDLEVGDGPLALVAGIIRQNGGLTLLQILDAAGREHVRTETSTGTIRAETEYGRIVMVLSREHKYAPVSLVIDKSSDAKIGPNQTVKEYKMSQRYVGSMQIKVLFNDFTLMEDLWIPLSFTVEESVTLQGDPVTVQRRWEHKITDFALARLDEPLTPVTYIPDNFPVTVEGAEMIDHVWRDGKVVKVVDQSVVADLTAQRFKKTNTPLLALLILGGIAAGAGGVYLLARRWRRAAMGVAR